MSIESLIIKPLVTEKSVSSEEKGKYIFKVLKNANKIEIKKAIEKIFSVKVKEVNILNTKSKTRRRGKIIGRVSGYKKAIVTLQKGHSIKMREEKKEEKKKNAKGKESEIKRGKRIK